MNDMIKIKQNNGNVINSIWTLEGTYEFFKNGEVPGCKAGLRYFVVTPQGTMRPCSMHHKDYHSQKEIVEQFVQHNTCGECYVASDPKTIPVTGILEKNLFSDIKIYPNPSQGVFIIDMDNQILGSITIEIFDPSGKPIFNTEIEKPYRVLSAKIDLRGFDSGVYFIKFVFDENELIKKLIIGS